LFHIQVMTSTNSIFYKSILVCCAIVFSLGGCAYQNRNSLLKTPFDADTIKNVFVINSKTDTAGYYNTIKPEDELAISDLQDIGLLVRTEKETYSQRTDSYAIFKVNLQGFISLPLLGAVKVAGLNRTEAANLIQNLYEQKELRKPLIDVRVNNLYVVLIGEVAKQGKYLINREDYELIDLLGEAGGLTPAANKRLVKIFRGDRTNPEIILVNMQDYSFLKNKNLRLKSRDVVYVEPKRWASNAQNLQLYSTFFQIGFLALNTILLIINISN
jgi:polysaccharide export outer membrane protein